jgi:hypothetical protein
MTPLDKKLQEALEDYWTSTLQPRIVAHAEDLGSVSIETIGAAIGQIAPTVPQSESRSAGFAEKYLVLIVAAVMALAFGALALIGSGRPGLLGSNSTGFLDIAKVFAGSVVGSSAGVAAASVKSHRR